MKWLLLFLPVVAFAHPAVVTINGVESSLIVKSVHLESSIDCSPGEEWWSEFDPHFRGKLDGFCIDVQTGEGIDYDVCNGLGSYVAVTEWQSAGNRCYAPDEYENRCDGFSPRAPGCD